MMKAEDRFKVTSYRNEYGYVVFTELTHLNRGHCCGNRCLHCPYTKPIKKGNTEIRDDIKYYMRNDE